MRIMIIRHAEPDYDNNTITQQGHLEAKALARRLRLEGVDRIYSSPLGRALHTMQYTAEATGIKPVIEPWMTELQGWYITEPKGTDRVAWNVDGEWVRANRPLPSSEDWHQRHPFDKPDFYKNYEMLKTNADRFLLAHGYRREDGKYEIIQSNQERIAIFCHHGFGLAWLAHLLELPLSLVWTGFWLAPSSVTTILFEERTVRWAVPRCLGLGDVSHIYEGKLPISSSGLQANTD
ncbi:histidine phosphatase family protein [Paenibacillus sp. LMG 31460]|uniref:Histidine phosphatase family protein n=1 Tax=Paenibacillus germinis TaxID=2654979 RepID=A0ABX1YWJ9_9BACL|nr:histidine phosphatase family protein [Paenibacillus germinis]NOU85327.1 histidine phosphatase family protein [Paenibacillus germinis]